MQMLIFSDTHLTNRFDEKKYRFMAHIITCADSVIINGDFWDGYITSFTKFINSPWQNLFPLLKKKNTIYLYGNHDKAKFADHRVSLFSAYQFEKYTMPFGQNKLIIQHGHKLLPAIDDRLHIGKSNVLIKQILLLRYRYARRMLKKKGEKYIYDAYSKYNARMKKNIQKNSRTNELAVVGHSHYGEIDFENRFINSGSILDGYGQYVLITDNSIELKTQWYG